MMKRINNQQKLSDSDWGALGLVSRASQLLSDNYSGTSLLRTSELRTPSLYGRLTRVPNDNT